MTRVIADARGVMSIEVMGVIVFFVLAGILTLQHLSGDVAVAGQTDGEAVKAFRPIGAAGGARALAAAFAQVDLLGGGPPVGSSNWVDPGGLNQGRLGDCFLVATLDVIDRKPNGREYLASRVTDQGNGYYSVTLRRGDHGEGEPDTFTVRAPPADHGGSGDERLRVLEYAIAANMGATTSHDPPTGFERPEDTYRSVKDGASSTRVMRQLGLEPHYGFADEVIPKMEKDGGFTTVSTPDLAHEQRLTLTPDGISREPFDRRKLADYDLEQNHVYGVVRTYQDPTTKVEMVQLRNSWGHSHPKPIPLSEINTVTTGAVGGTVPK